MEQVENEDLKQRIINGCQQVRQMPGRLVPCATVIGRHFYSRLWSRNMIVVEGFLSSSKESLFVI